MSYAAAADAELEDLGATDDAAKRKSSLGDGRLDGLYEALPADDLVTARQRLHRRLCR